MRKVHEVICRFALASFLLLVSMPPAASAQERRLALVIGVSQYDELASLDRPVDDAWLVADALKKHAGFNVTPIMDPTADALRAQVTAFVAKVRENDAVVVYYAGHGIQAAGRNYILPSDFPNDAAAIARLGLPIGDVLQQIGSKRPALKLLILDACRNNPLKGVAAGLAQMEPADYGPGTRIEFAAAAGKVALDGLFAKHLAQELVRPGQEVDAVFRSVRQAVSAESNGMQTTYSASQLVVNFFFVAPSAFDADRAIALLERTAAAMPQGELGQTAAVESLLRNRYSLAGTRLLRGVALRGGNFAGGDLSTALLTASDLSGTNLSRANLSTAGLVLATLKGAQFTGATLTGARVILADAACGEADASPCASFATAKAAESTWFGTSARGADFSGADLTGARLTYADLRQAKFDGATLRGASFVGSDLRGATFAGATFDATDFAYTRLDAPVRAAGACATHAKPSRGYVELRISEEFQEKYRDELTALLFHRDLPTALPACQVRPYRSDDRWAPAYALDGQPSLRGEYGVVLDRALLDRTGLRSTIRARVNQLGPRGYPLPAGTFRPLPRTTAAGWPPPFPKTTPTAADPGLRLRFDGNRLEIVRDGKVVWQATVERPPYEERRDPNAMHVNEASPSTLCGSSALEWTQIWMWHGDSRFTFAEDSHGRGARGATPCEARDRLFAAEFELVPSAR